MRDGGGDGWVWSTSRGTICAKHGLSQSESIDIEVTDINTLFCSCIARDTLLMRAQHWEGHYQALITDRTRAMKGTIMHFLISSSPEPISPTHPENA
jgi:hypothetical protein